MDQIEDAQDQCQGEGAGRGLDQDPDNHCRDTVAEFAESKSAEPAVKKKQAERTRRFKFQPLTATSAINMRATTTGTSTGQAGPPRSDRSPKIFAVDSAASPESAQQSTQAIRDTQGDARFETANVGGMPRSYPCCGGGGSGLDERHVTCGCGCDEKPA